MHVYKSDTRFRITSVQRYTFSALRDSLRFIGVSFDFKSFAILQRSQTE